MLQNIKLTERTKEQLELENDTLRQLLHDYVAQVELLKKVFNEQALEWTEEKQHLLSQLEQLKLTDQTGS
jgi:hypothetical protein